MRTSNVLGSVWQDKEGQTIIPGWKELDLKGIILDWSDAQLAGLKEVVGDEGTTKVVKGCQVGVVFDTHYTKRSPSI